MPQERTEVVRAVYDEWGRGNFRAGTELYDRHAVFIQGPEFPDGGTYLGLDAIRGFMRAFLEAFERVTIEAQELEASGDSVVASVLQRGEGKGSGATAELRYFHVWTFRGDRMIRLEVIRDRADVDAALASR